MVEYDASPTPTNARKAINAKKLRCKDPMRVDSDHMLNPKTSIHFRL